MASEQLVEDIFRKVLAETDDTVVTACLFRLADRGVFAIRELPEVAVQLKKRHGDQLSTLSDGATNYLASMAGLPISTGGRE